MAQVFTADQVSWYQLATLKTALSLHIRTGGKMRMTRNAGITTLLKLASGYTGVTYKRSQAQLAYDHITQLVRKIQELNVQAPQGA